MEQKQKPALFVGGLICDVTTEIDRWPDVNEKITAVRQIHGPGGGAANAALCYAKLGQPRGIRCEFIAPVGLDSMGGQFRQSFGLGGIQIHPRDIRTTPVNFVRPNGDDRTVIRAPSPVYLQPGSFPDLDVGNYHRLHLDGKEPDAALHYAREFRARGLQVSLDVNVRDNTDELLEFVSVAFASEKYFRSRGESLEEFFKFLRGKGCTAGGVTFGAQGVSWFAGDEIGEVTAYQVPIVDSSGAGDAFQGGLLAACDLWGDKSWQERVQFAAAVGAFMVQQYGNEQFPSFENVMAIMSGRPTEVRAAVNQ